MSSFMRIVWAVTLCTFVSGCASVYRPAVLPGEAQEDTNVDQIDTVHEGDAVRVTLISGNEMLQRVSIGYRFVGNLVATDREPDQLLEEHLAVVEAGANNQPDEAERLARLHVARSADSINRHEA